MYSKCYPIITASNKSKDEKKAPLLQNVCSIRHLNENWYVLTSNTLGVVKHYPVYINSFPFSTPHHLLESEKFNIRYTEPSKIADVANKLRWYRYHHSLLQREVADKIGVSRSTYIHYEETEHDYYPIDHMEKLSALYGVPVTNLLDDYNTFLYHDQGKQIQAMRQSLNMTQCEYSHNLGVPLGTLKKWEQNQSRLQKSTWERLFKQPKN